MNTTSIAPPDALPQNTHFEFELNQRVSHAQYGAGTIRGFLQRDGQTLWLVHFDAAPTIPTPHGAVPVSQLFPVATRDLQPA